MTIRQSLVRRANRAASAAVLFLLVAANLIVLGPRNIGIRGIFVLLMLVVVAAIVGQLLRIPCPNCQRSLGWAGFRAAHRARPGDDDRCPNCQVGFDAQVPAVPGAGADASR